MGVLRLVRKVHAGAGNQVIRLFKNFPHTPRTAISELVDNSVQSYKDNKNFLKKSKTNYRLKITIEIDRGNITIIDNAAGISNDKLDHAFEIANPPPNTKKDDSLNEFGFGMKGAAYWFCDVWTVQTKSIKENVVKTIKCDAEKIMKSDDAMVNVDEQRTNIKNSYTQITLKNIRQHIKSHKEIMEELSSSHRRYLRSNEIEIRYIVGRSKDEILKFDLPKFRKEAPWATYREWLEKFKDSLQTRGAKALKPKEVVWKLDIGKISFGGEKNYFATGWVAKMDVSKRSISGLYYIRRNKIMSGKAERGGRYFPKPLFNDGYDGSQMSNIIYGEIDFCDHIPSTIEKNALAWTQSEENEFHEKLEEVLKNKFIPGTKVCLVDQLKLQDERFKELFSYEKDIDKGNTDMTYEEHKKFQKNHGLGAAAKSIVENNENPLFKRKNEAELRKYPGQTISLDHEVEKVKIGKKTYKFTTELGFDEKYVDPWLEYTKNETSSLVKIRINVKHPFLIEYFTVNSRINQELILKGLRLLAGYIVVSEIDAKNEKAVRKAEEVRSNLNKILLNLPPSEKRIKEVS